MNTFDGTHVTHCCATHGCKYGDADCPVVTGRLKQAAPCDLCIEEMGAPVTGLDVTCISILLFLGHWPDKVYLETTLFNPYNLVMGTGLAMNFEAPSGTGLQYVQEYLAHKWPNARIEVVDTATEKRTVVREA